MNNFRWHPIAIIVGFLVFFSVNSHAAAVRVSWNQNSDNDLDGYTVYYGPSSRNYTVMASAGLSTSLDVDTSTLTKGKTYYFAVTAKDIYGNESVFSQEVTVTVPEATIVTENPGSSTISNSASSASTAASTANSLTTSNTAAVVAAPDLDSDGIPDSTELLWGLDPKNPLDALQDSDSDGVVNLVEYMADTDPLNPINRPSSDDILKDIIGEVGEIVDLTNLNPTGNYSFKPILAVCPDVAGNTVTMGKPGVYLYNVYDSAGMLIYCIRISMATKLFTTGSFEPGSPLNLEEFTLGISISLRADAALRQVPIGIANSESDASSAVHYTGSNSVEFELLPSGLTLTAPAQISIEFDGENPIVQKYNEQDGSWNNIAGVSFQDGLVTFSAQKLGRFRVYSEASSTTEKSETSSGGGGGGCFINTAGL